MPTANFSVSVMADEQGETCFCVCCGSFSFFLPQKSCSTGSKLLCEPTLGTQAVPPTRIDTTNVFLQSLLAPCGGFTDFILMAMQQI